MTVDSGALYFQVSQLRVWSRNIVGRCYASGGAVLYSTFCYIYICIHLIYIYVSHITICYMRHMRFVCSF